MLYSRQLASWRLFNRLKKIQVIQFLNNSSKSNLLRDINTRVYIMFEWENASTMCIEKESREEVCIYHRENPTALFRT